MGGRRPRRPSQRRLRNRVAVDPQRLRALCRLPRHRGRARRIQRQVHGQPTGAARLVAGHARRAQPRHLSQFLLSQPPMAIHRTAPRRLRQLISSNATAPEKRVQETVMNVHTAALAKTQPFDEATAAFASDGIDDLSQHPKPLSPKNFYDAAGSELFEQITVLPEYYPTRTELAILRDRGREISASIPKGAALVEFGAGATTHVRLLVHDSAFRAYGS